MRLKRRIQWDFGIKKKTKRERLGTGAIARRNDGY